MQGQMDASAACQGYLSLSSTARPDAEYGRMARVQPQPCTQEGALPSSVSCRALTASMVATCQARPGSRHLAATPGQKQEASAWPGDTVVAHNSATAAGGGATVIENGGAGLGDAHMSTTPVVYAVERVPGDGRPSVAEQQCAVMDGMGVVDNRARCDSSRSGTRNSGLCEGGSEHGLEPVGCLYCPGNAEASRAAVGVACSTEGPQAGCEAETGQGGRVCGPGAVPVRSGEHEAALALQPLGLCGASERANGDVRERQPEHTLPGQRGLASGFPGFPCTDPGAPLGLSGGAASMRIASLADWLPCLESAPCASQMPPIPDSMPLPTEQEPSALGQRIHLEDEGLQALFKQEQILGVQAALGDASVQQYWDRIAKVSSLLESSGRMTP